MHKFRMAPLLALLMPLCARGQSDTASTVTDTTSATVDSATFQTDTVAVEASDSLWYNHALNPVTLHPRHLPKGVVDSLRRLDDFWYVSVGKDKPKPPKIADSHSWWIRLLQWLGELFQKPWWAFFWWSVLAGVLVAAIVYIVQSVTGVRWFGRHRKLTGDDDKTADEIPEDPEEALKKALAAGDYREAERFLYLTTLKRLGQRGLVRILKEKTNREYLSELRGHELYDAFARLTRHYDYTWYGGFVPSPAAFEDIRAQFDQFQNRLDTL